MNYALGIDLGGSSIKSVAVTPNGQTLHRDNVEFEPGAHMDWSAKIQSLVAALETKVGHPAVAVGLSAPGLAAADNRAIQFMPGRLQGLEGLDWTTFLNRPATVPVLNDAHAALLGECWLGAARNCRDVFLLTLGTGVGGAAMVDGHLLRGHIGRAGHLGHICLDPDGPPDVTRLPGSLEVAIGNCSIQQRTANRFQTTHDLVQAHLQGDPDATRIWLASVRHLACAISSLINVLDPEAVIIGGGIARSGPALFEPLRRFLDEVEWQPGGHSVPMRAAELGEFAGAYGAAHRALT